MSRRRTAVLLAPVAVPTSMAVVFAVLRRRLSPRAAYNVGFLVYWTGWGLAFPLWVLGPRRTLQLLRSGRRPTPVEIAVLLAPVAGAVTTELAPNRRDIDAGVAAVMALTGVVNAVGEELLWRGAFLETFPRDRLRGVLWPLAGFATWHLAPQLVLPSRHGRWGLVLGSAVVGSSATLVGRRQHGLLLVVPAHIATDVCGVTAARFRLGCE